jgi:hypothetical protein
MKIHFVWGFCMGAQGAETPKTPVSAPGSGAEELEQQGPRVGERLFAALGRVPQAKPSAAAPPLRSHSVAADASRVPCEATAPTPSDTIQKVDEVEEPDASSCDEEAPEVSDKVKFTGLTQTLGQL